jgi:tetratricopeptide (TPR) repeat protein
MPHSLQTIRVSLIAIFAVLLSSGALAQTAPTTFERGLTYLTAIEEMDTKFDGLRAAGNKLIAERQDTLNRLVQTNKTVSEILQTKAYQSILLAQTQIVAASMQAELNGMLTSPTQKSLVETGIDNRHTPQTQLNAQLLAPSNALVQQNFQKTVSAQGNQLARVKVEYDLILHQMKTLNEAGRLAVERHVSIVQELEKIVNEMLVWESKTMELFNQYWSLADVAGVKSYFELRAALRQLKSSSNENIGAMFFKAITLARLQQNEEAVKLLNRLYNVPAIRVIVTAAHADILARTDKKREALSELRKTVPIGLNDPRVRMHRAVAFAACDEFKLAEAEWEALLKFGGHEIAARRAIALLNASNSEPSDRNKARATDYAKLAVQLDSEDWASELALALAHAVNGEPEKGTKSAMRAAELAVGENREYCDEIGEKIRLGEPVNWRFRP